MQYTSPTDILINYNYYFKNKVTGNANQEVTYSKQKKKL